MAKRQLADYTVRREAERLVERTADRIRTVYIEERRAIERMRSGRTSQQYFPGPRWDGKAAHRGGKEQKAIWPSIARFLIARQLDPDSYIRQVLRTARTHGSAMMPNQLMSDWAVELYERWQAEFEEQIGIAFRFHREQARSTLAALTEDAKLTTAQRWELMLLDESKPLTALFRYCLAVSEGYRKIAKHYHEQALMEYLCAPGAYDRHYGKWIPARLRKEADAVRTQATNKE